MKSNYTIFFSVGEASADAHAADLMASLKNHPLRLNFYGMGGPKMREQGCNIIVDNSDLAVVGLFEIIQHLPQIFNAYNLIKNFLKENRPDVVILIDYPGLNLRIAKYAKKLGLKVIYYIPPQLWAWKQGRIKKIKRYVNEVWVLYPFELELYQRHTIRALCVENPLVSEREDILDRTNFCNKYHLNVNAPIIGLAPGSRKGEISRMLEILLKTCIEIKKASSEVQFVLPLAPTIDKGKFLEKLAEYPELNIEVITQDKFAIFQHADIFIAVSGTVTVEIALAQTPTVVIYKLAYLTYLLARCLVKIQYISLTNIIMNEEVFPELIQENANSQMITSVTLSILNDGFKSSQIKEKLHVFSGKLRTSNLKPADRLIIFLQEHFSP